MKENHHSQTADGRQISEMKQPKKIGKCFGLGIVAALTFEMGHACSLPVATPYENIGKWDLHTYYRSANDSSTVNEKRRASKQLNNDTKTWLFDEVK